MVAYKNRVFESKFQILSFPLPHKNNISSGATLIKEENSQTKPISSFISKSVSIHLKELLIWAFIKGF